MLNGTIDGRQFTIEFMMGIPTIYMPTADKWEASAPVWAKGQWERVRADLATWCKENGIPLVIEENAWVEFD